MEALGGNPLPAKPEYELTIHLHTLTHLGIRLYGKIKAVSAEVVAKALDPDAGQAEIGIDPADQTSANPSDTAVDNSMELGMLVRRGVVSAQLDRHLQALIATKQLQPP